MRSRRSVIKGPSSTIAPQKSAIVSPACMTWLTKAAQVVVTLF